MTTTHPVLNWKKKNIHVCLHVEWRSEIWPLSCPFRTPGHWGRLKVGRLGGLLGIKGQLSHPSAMTLSSLRCVPNAQQPFPARFCQCTGGSDSLKSSDRQEHRQAETTGWFTQVAGSQGNTVQHEQDYREGQKRMIRHWVGKKWLVLALDWIIGELSWEWVWAGGEAEVTEAKKRKHKTGEQVSVEAGNDSRDRWKMASWENNDHRPSGNCRTGTKMAGTQDFTTDKCQAFQVIERTIWEYNMEASLSVTSLRNHLHTLRVKCILTCIITKCPQMTVHWFSFVAFYCIKQYSKWLVTAWFTAHHI